MDCEPNGVDASSGCAPKPAGMRCRPRTRWLPAGLISDGMQHQQLTPVRILLAEELRHLDSLRVVRMERWQGIVEPEKDYKVTPSGGERLPEPLLDQALRSMRIR